MIPGAVKRRSGAPYAIPTEAPYNAPTFCDVPTYDNTGSSLHFSVIDMHQEIGRDWRGWRFWATMTPYYQQNMRLENPSIIVSHDGYHWVLPNGLKNPIFPAPTNPAYWNADGDIAYDPSNDTIVLGYQSGEWGGQCFARSYDGAQWPARAGKSGQASVESSSASQSILRDSDGSWLLYAVYTAGSGESGFRTVMRWRSDHSGGPFLSPGQACTGLNKNTFPLDGPWHMEVLLDNGIYRALIWAGWTKGLVFPASSSDGLAWSRSANPILRPSADEPSLAGLSRWDSSETYRGSFTPHENGTHYRVWYSGTPGGKTTTTSWRIGYTEIPKSAWPAPPT